MPTNATSTPQGKYVKANGLKMYYEEYGTGEPLILLHGAADTSQEWQPNAPLFAQHFRILALDSRGHGRTDNPAGKFSFRLLADDVAAFVEELGLVKPLICGHSQGGFVVLQTGLQHPRLAGALVISGASCEFTEARFETLKNMGIEGPNKVNLEYIEESFPEAVQHWRESHGRPDDPDYWKTFLMQISTMWTTLLDYAREDFEKITTPTLIILGDRDGWVSVDEAVEMYHLIPNSELAILPNTGHTTHLENWTPTVLDFLLRHSTRSKQE